MKLAIKALKKHLKDNKKTISDLICELTQAKLKIKQLTPIWGVGSNGQHLLCTQAFLGVRISYAPLLN